MAKEVFYTLKNGITKEELSKLDTEMKRTFPQFIEPLTLRTYSKAIQGDQLALNAYFFLYAPEVWKFIRQKIEMLDQPCVEA